MRRLTIIFLICTLSSCAVHRVNLDYSQSDLPDDLESLTVTKSNVWPGGFQCFEPYLYAITLGVIPTHCVDTYEVLNGDVEVGRAKVTYMQGWAPLLLLPLPSWKSGYEADVKSEVIQAVSADGAQIDRSLGSD